MSNADPSYSPQKSKTYLLTSKGNVTIRTAIGEDAAHLLALRLEALAMHPEAFAADLDRTAADGENAWVECITEYSNTQSGAIMIAVAGEELIGMSGIVRGHWPKTMHHSSLWGVYVKPDWRRHRIGEALVNRSVEWAVENGMNVVILGVTNSNTAAIRCYSRCGFKEYGIEPKAIHYNDRYYDDLLMVKLI